MSKCRSVRGWGDALEFAVESAVEERLEAVRGLAGGLTLLSAQLALARELRIALS